MLSSDSPFYFHATISSLPIDVAKDLKIVKILNNFVIHHRKNTFYQ